MPPVLGRSYQMVSCSSFAKSIVYLAYERMKLVCLVLQDYDSNDEQRNYHAENLV